MAADLTFTQVSAMVVSGSTMVGAIAALISRIVRRGPAAPNVHDPLTFLERELETCRTREVELERENATLKGQISHLEAEHPHPEHRRSPDSR